LTATAHPDDAERVGTIKRYGLQDKIDIHIIDNGSGGIVSQFARLQGWEPDETTWARAILISSDRYAYGFHVNVYHTRQEGVWPILEAEEL